MKKIENMAQLRAAKKKLQRRKQELEKAIHYDWLDLKESLRPKNAAAQWIEHVFSGQKKAENEKSLLSEAASAVASQLAEKAVEKLTRWVTKSHNH